MLKNLYLVNPDFCREIAFCPVSHFVLRLLPWMQYRLIIVLLWTHEAIIAYYTTDLKTVLRLP